MNDTVCHTQESHYTLEVVGRHRVVVKVKIGFMMFVEKTLSLFCGLDNVALLASYTICSTHPLTSHIGPMS